MRDRILRGFLLFVWMQVCIIDNCQGCKSLAGVWLIVWLIWTYRVGDMDAFSYCVIGEEERREGGRGLSLGWMYGLGEM